MTKQKTHTVRAVLIALGHASEGAELSADKARMAGIKWLAKAVGVTQSAVHHMQKKNIFPAAYRDMLSDECARLGFDVDSTKFKSLFKMKRARIKLPSPKVRGEDQEQEGAS